jgi:hypothetical protein
MKNFIYIFKTIISIFSFLLKKGEQRCEVHFIGRFIYKVWDEPGKWSSEDEIKKIQSDLLIISKNSQGKKDIPLYGPLLPGRENLRNKLITIAYDKKTGKPAGFCAQTHIELQNSNNPLIVTHLGLVYIDPAFQKKGMASILYVLPNVLNYIRMGMRPYWISSVTQVPAVVGMVSKHYAYVYPSCEEGNYQSAEQYLIGKEIMKSHRHVFGVGEDAEYDAKKQIILNAYTGGSDNLKKSFEESSKYRDEKYNDLCKNSLDYDRGDDFLQLGKLNVDTLLKFSSNKACDRPILSKTLNVSILIARNLYIPIFRFIFTTKKPGEIKVHKWKMQ